MKPIKRILSDHHFDKLCALDTLHSLLTLNTLQSISKDIVDRLKLKQNEPLIVKMKKIKILSDLFVKYGCEMSLKELVMTTKNPNKHVKIEAIKSIGECGRLLTKISNDGKEVNENQSKNIGMILQVLIGLLKFKDEQIMTESMISL